MVSSDTAVAADPTEIVVVYVTAPQVEAPALARALVERRLAACVNIVPSIRSFYVWEGEVRDEPEALLIVKSTRARFEALAAAIEDLHSYEVPEVIALPVLEGNEPYCAWVVRSVGGHEP